MSKIVPRAVAVGLVNNAVPDAALALSKTENATVPATVITMRHNLPGAALSVTVPAPLATAWLNLPPNVERVSPTNVDLTSSILL
jgi:hypothetical protein